ncbi:UDP-N-acetylglucosamine 2-epimerase [Halobaculum sp. MBLA0147]|uniref:UDP-N-acetylglucosamine 2-epimerase n=1 Tax=Halobaculum sp. MBLA0147 TaxID=3079934 RepID=UPI003525271F
MSRRITVVTGTRAEYGLLSSPMEAIRRHPSLELTTVATGMHLSETYGHTVDEIEADGFTVDRTVETLLNSDTGRGMAKSLGLGINGTAEALASLDTDVTLVLGDRDEALAGAVASAHMNVPVAHIHGGDSMHGATIDDSIRHAITKFAHVHFPASDRSADRIEQLGEESWRITTVGAPGLDAILADEYESGETVRSKHGLNDDAPLIVVVQHPVTTQSERAADQMRATLKAVCDRDASVVVIYPNSDSGSAGMIEALDSFQDEVRDFKSLPRGEYLGLLDAADVLVGNSSSGIIEAPSLDLPVVDVGPRQDGRQRADNVLSVPHDRSQIARAVEQCLEGGDVRERAVDCDNPYDRGGAGDRIAEALAAVDLDEELSTKRFVERDTR